MYSFMAGEERMVNVSCEYWKYRLNLAIQNVAVEMKSGEQKATAVCSVCIGLTGNITTAYDTGGVVSDADGPIIAKLHSNTTQPVLCAGSIAVQVANAVAQNVKSFEGQLDVHANHQDGAYGRKPVVLSPWGVQKNQSHGSSHYIPKNSISPANDLTLTSKPQKPRRSGINPQADYPQPVSIQSHSQPIRGHYPSVPNIPPSITTVLFPLPPILLPTPASPISPLLAAPPQAHYSPFPSPSSSHPSPHRHTPSSFPLTPRHILPHAPASSTSESIKGVSVRLDEIDRQKGSSSPSEENILKKIAWSSALMTLVIIAVVVGVVIVKNSKSDNSSKTEGNL
ncbi:hypothetical protein I308_106562 [Cryptococcus tetragattii IND107]|uniref:Uncharacterized protein n=1 Tax=Cryptococcus tetragattii IND107 TaxID=1296105 RepID=A0ABR3BI17_9TREE